MRKPKIAIATLAVAATLCLAQTPKRLGELAWPLQRPGGAPTASDVIMRSLRLHPTNKNDPHDTMRAIEDFHVTRLEWAYIRDAAFIRKVTASGRLFGGAASAPSYIPPQGVSDWFEKVVIVDLAGRPIIAPWKRQWKRTLWGCINNAELERGYVEYLKRHIDAGAQVMQRDEPGTNLSATRWGGCFCGHCMKAFREYLAKNTTPEKRRALGIADVASFDYRRHAKNRGGGELKKLFVAFQTQATLAFHRRTRKAIDRHAGRRVPMSCNNGTHRWGPIEMEFDWAFGELSFGRATAAQLHETFKTARRHGRLQVVTMPKKGDRKDLDAWRRRTRQTIATVYALGGLCMVPWDVYMPNNAPRYFGTPQQYADLYGFIRANANYLVGYEYAGALGCGIRCDLYGRGKAPLRLRTEGGTKVCAVIRAQPAKADGPVVIHLIDWSDRPSAVNLDIEPNRFFGDRPLRITLLTPPSYDRRLHQEAEKTRSYAKLTTTRSLARGRVTSVRVPALSPWGMVIVQPE